MRPLIFHGAAQSKQILVCFSHLRWNFVWQRPQHLLRLAAEEYSVLYIEEPVIGDVVEANLQTRHVDGVTVAVPMLPAGLSQDDMVFLQRQLIDAHLSTRPDPAVLWYYTPMALAFSSHIEADLVIYDNMDELTAFRGAPAGLLDMEEALLAKADLVFTGGLSLYEAKKHRHPEIFAFPSSVDAGHFASARDRSHPEPEDQSRLPGPRLGYFGVIDERLDLPLLEATAALRPDWQFVMVGPVAKIDPASLPKLSNIHWLGLRSYSDLPAYLRGWDVGLMPFALNEATRFISPTKTPEFLAAGVPVVSTAIRDVVRPYGELGLVRIADNAADFVACAEAAMAQSRPDWLARVDRLLDQGSWSATWKAMRAVMAGKPESAALSRRREGAHEPVAATSLQAAE